MKLINVYFLACCTIISCTMNGASGMEYWNYHQPGQEDADDFDDVDSFINWAEIEKRANSHLEDQIDHDCPSEQAYDLENNEEKTPLALRIWVCAYPGCNKIYKSNSGLQGHKKKHQTPQQVLQDGNPNLPQEPVIKMRACPHPGCPKRYKTASGFFYHTHKHHPYLYAQNRYPCLICSRRLKTQGSLNYHLLKIHKVTIS